MIAIACLLHGAGLAAAVLLYPVAWPGITAALLVTAGLFGPLLAGGISSRLPAIAGPDRTAQRRAQGWDVTTYSMGGTIGPSVVALLTATASATLAGLLLAAATFVAAILVRFLPAAPRPMGTAGIPKPIKTLHLLIDGEQPVSPTRTATRSI